LSGIEVSFTGSSWRYREKHIARGRMEWWVTLACGPRNLANVWLDCGLLCQQTSGIPRHQPRSYRTANFCDSLFCRLCMWENQAEF
jgi:hypothetical protein